ncbi:LytTR family transcriptional regulator DNA-binding domain-containing protein [Cohnella ginsengisoli]|uniref:LytTR family transcriptional regulator DNA-binding domain-containing protein n=1 Tax=Cohnella ginsengisoli TaxID=425004 RepID=A0A9X4QME9_9BACL|nr:LytTR family transcriptional regulator DNA-binding domain-containing protein [Cohnella ginsengisoli]MDG0791271.1 LytTR family transcriptional regulator DNA-binding domain-containing protein [Cohnella ginsengisoli]
MFYLCFIEFGRGEQGFSCKENVYEVKHKLYELEEMCREKKCFRASKSAIINIAKIARISPSFAYKREQHATSTDYSFYIVGSDSDCSRIGHGNCGEPRGRC